MIYILLLVPIIFAYFFYRMKYPYGYYLGSFGITILGMILIPVLTSKIATTDKEYWGGYVSQAFYEEDWNEYIHQTCTMTQSDGKGGTTTTYYDCSYVNYHPPQWYLKDSNGITISISQKEFNRLKNLFGNISFVELNRHYHSDDGDLYVTKYQGEYEKLVPVTTIHTYENRVQAANSVYKFETVSDRDKKALGLFDYPNIDGYDCSSILGAVYPETKSYLNRFNAINGAKKQLRVWLLVFRNKDVQSGLMQEQYWKGGNKNEFVICIGLDNENNFQWGHVFSWTPEKETLVLGRDILYSYEGKKIDLLECMKNMTSMLLEKFERKKFSEFQYLSIEPSPVLITTVLMILIAGHVGILILNPEAENKQARKSRYYY